jgi:hydroxyethylthiazole kinase-like uncharacterized protein yjeF
MIDAFTVAQIRAAEAPALAAGEPLMQRAATALAGVVRDELRRRGVSPIDARVAALIGPGDNGGDALFALAALAGDGVRAQALLVAGHGHEAGLEALRAAGGAALALPPAPEWAETAAGLAQADVVLDGILGIGAHGALREPAAGFVTALNAARAAADAPALAIAVDTPSGIGVDDGSLPGAVLTADVTVTFGGAKPGLVLPPAREACGRVVGIDLGYDLAPATVHRVEDADVARLWAVPGAHDHKYTRGVVGMITGSARYPGAAVLGASAAVRSGAGMVRYLGDRDALGAVLAVRPEVVGAEGRVQSWVLGSGLVDRDDRVQAAIGSGLPCVVDAGALASLPERMSPQVLLTPHAGELSALLGERGEAVDREQVEAEPVRWARRAHELTGATVLLKGAATIVANDAGIWVAAAAPAWLGTAGAGDVLAGLLGTVLAGHAAEIAADPSRTAAYAAMGAHVHGRAAQLANPGGPIAALDVADALGRAIAELLRAA